MTGLLQTERYARSRIAQYSKVEPIAPAIIERRVELRMRRKQVLEQIRRSTCWSCLMSPFLNGNLVTN